MIYQITHNVRSTIASWRYIGGLGTLSMIQLSIQSLDSSPLPISFRRPFCINSRPCKILLHAYYGLLPTQPSRKDERRKYRALRILATSELGEFHNLHACYAKRDWLNFLRSWKPNPPFSFSLQSFCHAIHGIFFLLFPLLHQNSAIALVSLAQTSLGSLKQDIA